MLILPSELHSLGNCGAGLSILGYVILEKAEDTWGGPMTPVYQIPLSLLHGPNFKVQIL